MYDIKKIKNYILMLNSEFSLSVSLHAPDFNNIINSKELSHFNIHSNSYCSIIKTKHEAQKHCQDCQKKVLQKCKKGTFCGNCYAGVFEYVYPINNGEEIVGFISVSGYKTENGKNYISRISRKYGFDENSLSNIYSMLKKPPQKRNIDILISPLCDMLELSMLKNNTEPNLVQSFPQRIEQYIKSNRNQNITSADICSFFSCSRSYMSTVFNKHFGKSIREYLTELRLSDAKSLLKYSDLNVTEIAFSVGFTDANYFSNLFKKSFDVSPTTYRKKSR